MQMHVVAMDDGAIGVDGGEIGRGAVVIRCLMAILWIRDGRA